MKEEIEISYFTAVTLIKTRLCWRQNRRGEITSRRQIPSLYQALQKVCDKNCKYRIKIEQIKK